MAADYHLDYRAFGEHVLNADWMVEEMRVRAERMKDFAEGISPYDPNDPDLEHYRDGFRVEAGKHGGVRKDRAEGVLWNDDKANVYVEYGNRNTPEHAVLRKSLDAAG